MPNSIALGYISLSISLDADGNSFFREGRVSVIVLDASRPLLLTTMPGWFCGSTLNLVSSIPLSRLERLDAFPVLHDLCSSARVIKSITMEVVMLEKVS